MRYLAILLLLPALLTGCDGDGPTGPAYPEVAGTYDFAGWADEAPGVRWVGTFTLVDDSPDTPEFSMTLVMNGIDSDGRPLTTVGQSTANGVVSKGGEIEIDRNYQHFWISGRLRGRTIRGTMFVEIQQGAFTVPITAERR